MFDEFQINCLRKKIEQIEREIKTLRKGIEEEDLYISEVEKGKNKLNNARGNLVDATNRIIERVSFLKSAEHMKHDFQTVINGSSYVAAEERIIKTKKDLEKEKNKQKKNIGELEQMKIKYERQLQELMQQMTEE